jgi:LemA protein
MSALQAAGLFAILLAVGIAAFLVVAGYNAVIGLRNRADKAWANVEVALRQRHDQLPNLVTAVRDVMAFEQEVLEEVTRQRARWRPDDPVPEQGAVSGETSRAVRSLFAVMERYPDIRSAENVLRLQAEIERLEEQIADRRELYNDQVFRYNTAIATLPMLLLAPLFGWRPRDFFEAGPEAASPPAVALQGEGPGQGS